MAIKKLEGKCWECKENFLVDVECNGDWYETIKGLVRQHWCPKCGKMWPLIKNDIPEQLISNHKKRKIAILAGKEYDLDLLVCIKLAKRIGDTTYLEFSREYAKVLNGVFGIELSYKAICRLKPKKIDDMGSKLGNEVPTHKKNISEVKETCILA